MRGLTGIKLFVQTIYALCWTPAFLPIDGILVHAEQSMPSWLALNKNWWHWVSLVDISHVLSRSLLGGLSTSMWLFWETTLGHLISSRLFYVPLPYADHSSPHILIILSHEHDYMLSPPTASSNLRVVLRTPNTIHHKKERVFSQKARLALNYKNQSS